MNVLIDKCLLRRLSHMQFLILWSFFLMTACSSSNRDLEEGRSLMQQGKFREAIGPLNKAIEADAENVEAFNSRGVAYFELKEYTSALLDYEQAIKLKPDFYRPYYNRALLKTAQNDVTGALKDYSDAIRLVPDTAKSIVSDIYLNRGQLFAAQGQEQAALTDFDQAIAKNKRNALALYNRGNLLFQQKKLMAAITNFRAAVEVQPTFGKAFYGMGIAQVLAGEQEVGCLSLKQAQQLGYADAPNAIAEFCQ